MKNYLLLLLLLFLLAGCTGPTAPREVKFKDLDLDTQQEMKRLSAIPGLHLNTVWRVEAQYLDGNDKALSTMKLEFLRAAGEWNSELAPMTVTPGWTAFRDPGQFGYGDDLESLLGYAPQPVLIAATHLIRPVDQSDSVRVPSGAQKLQARLLELCPIEIRFMEQTNRRPMGDVIAIRTKKEVMRWREFRVNGPCQTFPAPPPS